jgi:predicted metal-dependent hydrolase
MIENETNKIKIKDIELEYFIDYRNVKYTRYELRHGKLHLIIPKNNRESIEEIIHKKDKWIYKKLTKYYEDKKRLSKATKGMKVVQRSLPQLKQLVITFVEKYEKILNVKVNRIQYRDMVYKWGSCSYLKNVTLSKSLRYLPDRLVEYIVYHELVHLIVLAHNDKFFKIIRKEFPNYEYCDEKLDQYHFLISDL